MIAFHAPTPDQPLGAFRAAHPIAPDEIGEADFIDCYKTYGALLLSGFSVNIETFNSFTRKFCTGAVFNESRNREVLDPTHNIQSVNSGPAAFALHPELSREPWRPDVCIFWCISPPTSGGETTICDGVEIVRRMPPSLRAAFTNRRLLYRRQATPEELAYWLKTPIPSEDQWRNPPAGCPYRFTMQDGRLFREFSRPALHKPMFHSERAFGNFLLFARYMHGHRHSPGFENGEIVPDEIVAAVKAIGDELSVPISWKAGDIVVIDNSRFMHGRNAIQDPSRRRIASYFGYLRFAIPDAEEPEHAPWRYGYFRPPKVQQAAQN